MRVTVSCKFKSSGLAVKPPVNEDFYTDNAGFFRIKFLKRIDKRNVIRYSIWAEEGDGGSSLSAEDLQKTKGTIQIDTLWLKYNHIGKIK